MSKQSLFPPKDTKKLSTKISYLSHWDENRNFWISKTRMAMINEKESSGDHDEKESAPDPSNLSILTWNVLANTDANFRQRCHAIAKIVEEKAPTVICMQEVTPEFIIFLCGVTWVRSSYCISSTSGSPECNPYGLLILVNKSYAACIKNIVFHELPTVMNRYFVYFDIELAQTLRVATVHLESMYDTAFMRKLQMEVIFPVLDEFSSSILVGDMNMCNSRGDENKIISESSFVDVWCFLHPNQFGETMPKRHFYRPWRPDRVLINSSVYVPQSIEIIGKLTCTEVLKNESTDAVTQASDSDLKKVGLGKSTKQVAKLGVLTPSDHYGLFAEFNIS